MGREASKINLSDVTRQCDIQRLRDMREIINQEKGIITAVIYPYGAGCSALELFPRYFLHFVLLARKG